MLKGKWEIIAKMFVEQNFDVLTRNETKLKEKREREFGCIYLVVVYRT